MRKQIFSSILFTSIISTLLVSCLIFGVMYGRFYEEMKQVVKEELSLIEKGYAFSGGDYLNKLRNEDTRITLIASDGTVLYVARQDFCEIRTTKMIKIAPLLRGISEVA